MNNTHTHTHTHTHGGSKEEEITGLKGFVEHFMEMKCSTNPFKPIISSSFDPLCVCVCVCGGGGGGQEACVCVYVCVLVRKPVMGSYEVCVCV